MEPRVSMGLETRGSKQPAWWKMKSINMRRQDHLKPPALTPLRHHLNNKLDMVHEEFLPTVHADDVSQLQECKTIHSGFQGWLIKGWIFKKKSNITCDKLWESPDEPHFPSYRILTPAAGSLAH